MMDKLFPIGYLVCDKCGDVALWMVNKLNYDNSRDIDMVDVKLEYRLVNLKLKDLTAFPENVCICDSCGSTVESYNYDAKYLVFLDNEETTSKLQ